MKFLAFLFCSFAILTTLFGIHYEPWLTPNLVIVSETKYAFRTFGSVQTGHGTKKYSADDSFFNQSFTISALNKYSLELDTIFSQTARHTFALDSMHLYGRYLIWDDIAGDDPFTLTAGLRIGQIFGLARRDISVFHHKGIEFEVNGSIGKEWDCHEFWRTRVWGMLGCGVADEGSPWLRVHGEYAKNYLDAHTCRVYFLSLYGLGGDSLNKCHFSGYGPIKHRSIDLGVGYSYAFDTERSLDFCYQYRVYVKNGPRHVNSFQVMFVYNLSPNILGPILPKITLN